MMKKLYTIIAATIFVLLIAVMPEFTTTAVAQSGIPGFPGDEGGPPQIPIDGGLGILVAAGGAYAVHKLRKSKKD